MSGFTPASSMPVFVHRSRRGAELVLLILALVVGIGAYVAVGLGVQEKIPVDLLGYGAWLVVLLVAAHIGVRLMAPYADPVLLPLVAMLNGVGLAVIHRLDLALAEDADKFARQQLIWMTIGVVLFLITLFLVPDHRMLQRFTYTAGLAAVVMLILPMLPFIGKTINGARIWINLGPVSFQPGEVAKVLLVICFAGYLAVHRDALALAGRRFAGIDLPRARDLGPLLMMWAISLAILVLQRDLGSSLLFYGLFVVTLYVATERKGWIVVGGLLFAGGVFAALTLFSHVRVRVFTWLDPFKYYPVGDDGVTSSGQLVEGMFGMAWGGMIGRGFGSGEPWRIPYANSDFIIPAIGEELGLTALLALLLCYGLIVERGLRTAIVARDDFGKLLSVGLATSIALQTFVVVGGVTGLIPLTGLTTPFLSYGGSSLVANWVIIALLLRVSDQSRRPLPTAPSDEDLAAEETQIVKLDKGAMSK